MEDDNDEEDVFADPLSNDPKASQASAMLKKHRRENTEHSNPNSYSWIIMRLAIMKLAQNQLQEFINIAGIEMQGEGDNVACDLLVIRFKCEIIFFLQNCP